jgi:hypothetical protein
MHMPGSIAACNIMMAHKHLVLVDQTIVTQLSTISLQ